MQDLGVLPGDFVGAGLGLNNNGEVVGPSFAAPGPTSAIPRAFLWANGKMHDLNALVPPDSPLYLLFADGINDSGEIVGFGADNNGDIHAFLATPCRHEDGSEGAATAERAASNGGRKVVLSENARKQLQHLLRFRLPSAQSAEPQ